MVKIVGNFFLIFSFLCSMVLDAKITLELRTENGVRDQVVVGQPFTLDVVIDDVYGSVQAPAIKGLERFAAKRTGMFMSSVNGKSTTRYSYQVKIDTVGSYVLGPAMVTHEQQQLISHEVTINVVKDIGAHNKQQAATDTKAFLRLMVDAESVVIGQKIGCTLRFYYQDPSLSLHNIGMPELQGFDIHEIGKLETGIADLNGVQYRYAQWCWDMYPTQAGEFIVPAYNADYELPLKDNNLLGGLFMFMSNRIERKRVYSNAVTIKVAPLPYYNGHVDAIGAFERITAEIKPGMAKEGEGMVLAIEIEGIGNLNAIAVPKLIVPHGLKYYDSNSVIIMPQHSDELPKKRFEFIVQGMQCGDWEIPEQLFTYFDIERHGYITLRTSPLVVSIMPGNAHIKQEVVNPSVEQSDVFCAVVTEEGIEAINVNGAWAPITERQPLPWWIFQILFLIPCLYISYPVIVDKWFLLSNSSYRLRRRRAFAVARKKVTQSLHAVEDKNLYVIFTELCASLHEHNNIKQLLSDEQRIRWDDFFERITYAAYAQSHKNNAQELCRMAQEWIEWLEKNI